MAQLRKSMSEMIDITPTGMETPEGIARVHAAQEAIEKARLAVTRAASEMLPELDALRLGSASASWFTLDRHDYDEATADLRAAVAEWERATETFLRAVAGA